MIIGQPLLPFTARSVLRFRRWLTDRATEFALVWLFFRRELRLYEVTSHWQALQLPGPGRVAISRLARPWDGALVGVRLAPSTMVLGRILKLAGDEHDGRRIAPGKILLQLGSEQLPIEGSVDDIEGVALALLRPGGIQDLRMVVRHVPTPGRLLRLRVWSRELWTDVVHRAATRGIRRADESGFSPRHVFAYTPTPWDLGSRVLGSLSISRADVFVDYGAGKGRMLLLALEHPFSRVVGIEVVPELARAARRNTAIWLALRCDPSRCDPHRVA